LIRPARENGHLLKQAMQLLVILGWDGAGKSTLVFPLGELKGPAADQRKFFPARLVPPARERWICTRSRPRFKRKAGTGMVRPHDAVEVRLRAAGTIIFHRLLVGSL
jgi:hypothetical protein